MYIYISINTYIYIYVYVYIFICPSEAALRGGRSPAGAVLRLCGAHRGAEPLFGGQRGARARGRSPRGALRATGGAAEALESLGVERLDSS